MADTDIKEAKLPTTTVKHTKDVPISEVQKIYYASKSHTEASRVLGAQYGFTDRAFRYRLRFLEEHGFLEATSLPSVKQRDMEEIVKKREENKIKKPKPAPKEKKLGENVMVTVHFKIKYDRIGAKGFHPFYLEGYYSKVVPRDAIHEMVSSMMNYVQDRLNEFRALVGYLELKKEEFEEGVEVEELSETHKQDDDFRYNYDRVPVHM